MQNFLPFLYSTTPSAPPAPTKTISTVAPIVETVEVEPELILRSIAEPDVTNLRKRSIDELARELEVWRQVQLLVGSHVLQIANVARKKSKAAATLRSATQVFEDTIQRPAATVQPTTASPSVKSPPKPKCADYHNGTRCRRNALPRSDFCKAHQPERPRKRIRSDSSSEDFDYYPSEDY